MLSILIAATIRIITLLPKTNIHHDIIKTLRGTNSALARIGFISNIRKSGFLNSGLDSKCHCPKIRKIPILKSSFILS
jgi:hypothetical protein